MSSLKQEEIKTFIGYLKSVKQYRKRIDNKMSYYTIFKIDKFLNPGGKRISYAWDNLSNQSWINYPREQLQFTFVERDNEIEMVNVFTIAPATRVALGKSSDAF